MDVPAIQNAQYQAIIPQPNYNAVKIDINNPQVNAPTSEKSTTAPVYSSVPTASVYEVPVS